MTIILREHRWKAILMALAVIGLVLVPDSYLQHATLVILFLTFCAILWYTHETQSLRLQQFRPYVLLERSGDMQYKYVNAGNGAALNVRVVECRTNKGKINAGWGSVPYLATSVESHRYVMNATLTSGYDPINDAYLDGDSAHELEAKLRYEDVEGNTYETRIIFKYANGNILGSVKCSRRQGRN